MGNGKYPQPHNIRKYIDSFGGDRDFDIESRMHNAMKHKGDITKFVSYIEKWFRSKWSRRLPYSYGD